MASMPSMAHGWRACVDERGQTYYLHSSGHSQWEFPAMQVTLPRPPPMRMPHPQAVQQQFAMPQMSPRVHSPYAQPWQQQPTQYARPPVYPAGPQMSPMPQRAQGGYASPVAHRQRSASLGNVATIRTRSPMVRSHTPRISMPSPGAGAQAGYSFTLARPGSARRRPQSPRARTGSGATASPPASPRYQKAAAEEDASPWAEMQDDQGNVYYYNATTDESVWEKPASSHARMGTRAHSHAGGWDSEHVGQEAESAPGPIASPSAGGSGGASGGGGGARGSSKSGGAPSPKSYFSDGELHVTRRLELEAVNTSPAASPSGAGGRGKRPSTASPSGGSVSPGGRCSAADGEGEGESAASTPSTTRSIDFVVDRDSPSEQRRAKALAKALAEAEAEAEAARAGEARAAESHGVDNEKWRLALETERAQHRTVRRRADSHAGAVDALRAEIETLRSSLQRERDAVAAAVAAKQDSDSPSTALQASVAVAESHLLREELSACRATEAQEAAAARREITRREEEAGLALRECKAQANRAIAEWSSALDKAKRNAKKERKACEEMLAQMRARVRQ